MREGLAVASFLVLFAYTNSDASAATLAYNDCLGPPTPPSLSYFYTEGQQATASVSPNGKLRQIGIGIRNTVILKPISDVRLLLPHGLPSRPDYFRPKWGGFISVRVLELGSYWLSSSYGATAFGVIEQKSRKKIVARRTMSLPCDIVMVAEYNFKPGTYILQVVAPNTAVYMGIAPAGQFDGRFIEYKPPPRF